VTEQPHSWCSTQSKRSYGSKRSARKAHSTSSERLRYYRCPGCQGWHATSSSRAGLPRVGRIERGRERGWKPLVTPLCFVCSGQRQDHET
jgi:hypothetical protein